MCKSCSPTRPSCRAGAQRPAPLTRSRGLLQAGRAACEASCTCCARCGAGELQASSSCLEKRQCSAPDAREASAGCEAAGAHRGLSLPQSARQTGRRETGRDSGGAGPRHLSEQKAASDRSKVGGRSPEGRTAAGHGGDAHGARTALWPEGVL